jgi:hypothetical protein
MAACLAPSTERLQSLGGDTVGWQPATVGTCSYLPRISLVHASITRRNCATASTSLFTDVTSASGFMANFRICQSSGEGSGHHRITAQISVSICRSESGEGALRRARPACFSRNNPRTRATVRDLMDAVARALAREVWLKVKSRGRGTRATRLLPGNLRPHGQ